MARRAKFGQAPRPAPSLGSTIVAIAREMQAQEAQNLMDAWQKGGMFKGQKATDEVVLAYWRKRLTGLSKKDPLYDTYKNTVYQYDYTIHESKMTAAYAEGKVGEGQVARFYLDWAKKVPQDSEFYRVLQRDAAQWTRSAKAKSDAALKIAQEKAYQDGQQATYDQHEKAGDYIAGVLRGYMRAQGKVDVVSGDFAQFDPGDPAALLQFLDHISGQPGDPVTGKGGTGPLVGGGMSFRDPQTGKMVTSADVISTLTKLDPHFNGRITLSTFQNYLIDQQKGQAIRLKAAQKSGHASDANDIMKQQAYISELARETSAWPVLKQYHDAREQWLQTWADPSQPPPVKIGSQGAYAQTLLNLARTPGLDDNTKNRLIAEANGDASVNTLAEDALGLSPTTAPISDTANSADTAGTVLDLERFNAMVADVGAGKAVWTTGRTDAQGVFRPGAGTEIGSTSDVASLGADLTQIDIPQGAGMPTITLTVAVKPIKGQIVDAATGNPIAANTTDDANVGAYAEVPINGVPTRVFRYMVDGVPKWTRVNPYQDASNIEFTDGGAKVTLRVQTPDPGSVQDGDPTWTAHYAADGNVSYSANPQNLVVDPARRIAGVDQRIDFYSPTLAALSGTPDGKATITTMMQDPAFAARRNEEAMLAAGAQRDPQTGLAIPGTENPAMAAQARLQVAIAAAPLDTYQDAAERVPGRPNPNDHAQAWDKSTTRPIMGGKVAAAYPVNPLPSDLARNTDFGPIANTFKNGTAQFLDPFERGSGASIKLGPSITLPTIPAGVGGRYGPVETPTPPVASTVNVNPIGYQPPKSTTPSSGQGYKPPSPFRGV